ncbi:MAG: hypothetical protein FWE06_01500 [Oscillospiraceae bacterium]|nr:hypothetical protein [Oscillospiraceae bacterium]
MMFRRVSAGMLVVAAFRLYRHHFWRLLIFPLIFSTFATLGQMLLFQPMRAPLAAFWQNVNGENSVQAISAMRVLMQDVMPSLLLWLVYLATVGLLLNAFVVGGITRIAMTIMHKKDLQEPTQAIYSEIKYTPKWYVTALLQNVVLLVLVFVPSLAVGILALFLPAFASLGVFAVAFIAIVGYAAIAMFFPIVLCEEKGWRRAIPRTWQLFRRRPGLVITMGLWLIMLQAAATSFGALFAGGLPLQMAVTALLAPVSTVAVCMMYEELCQGVKGDSAEDLKDV